MKLWRPPRSLHTRMKSSILSLPSLSSPSSSSSTALRAFRTLFSLSNPNTTTLLPPPQLPSLLLSSNKQHSFSLFLPGTLILRRDFHFTKAASSGVARSVCLVSSFAVARCSSSISSTDTLDWNAEEFTEDDLKPSIPVRAYFFSTRLDVQPHHLFFQLAQNMYTYDPLHYTFHLISMPMAIGWKV